MSPPHRPSTPARVRLVTVDGPAGSGKTTLGRRLARALGLPLLDTGLLYRGVMAAALAAGVDASDPEAAAAIARTARIEINTDPGDTVGWEVKVDGTVVDTVARDPAHATLLAQLSGLAGVRAALLDQQRKLASSGAVAVGRDCGTVVFPWAPVKLYLQAPAEVRADRRAHQLRAVGARIDAGEIAADVAGRDALDTGRAVAPLRPAPDAHIIDTGAVGIEEMVAEALALCRRAGMLPPEESA